jgi:hypothetical protein
MSHHADHVRFAVRLDDAAGAAEDPADGIKVGETRLDRRAGRGTPEREGFKAVALGTGGFPVALKPRVLNRSPAEYRYRAALTPTGPLKQGLALEPEPAWAAELAPAWPPPPAGTYSALCVDGGAMNNEPLDLVRRVLAGYRGHSPRPADEACRAVVLIDPFVNPAKPGPEKALGLVGGILPLFNALVQNARFKPEDLAMAADPSVGSRFLLAPSRSAEWQAKAVAESGQAEGAIAAGHLGGFMGFFAKAYREHDYFLGRRNAQRFLRCVFVLPENNKLFKERWSDTDKKKWGVERQGVQGRHLPVIPLCGDLFDRPEPLPPWPAGRFDAAEIEALVRRRVDVALPALRDTLLGMALTKGGIMPWFTKLGVRTLGMALRPRIVEGIMAKLKAEAEKLDRKAG